MAYDDVFKYIGEIGRFQWIVFVVFFTNTVFVADMIQMVFIGGEMDHWCWVAELEGLPSDLQKYVAIPGRGKYATDGDSGKSYSTCTMFALDYSVYNTTDFENWNRTAMVSSKTPVVRCDRWVYDQSTFESTIVSKFNLVCGHSFMNQLVSSIYMAGILVGSASSGIMSDKFGRKPTMLVFSAVKVVGMFMSIFGPNYTIFVLGRFLMGTAMSGYYLSGYILVAELVGPSYRTIFGCVIHIAFSVGFMVQPVLAYVLRNEFTYQLAAFGIHYILPLTTLLTMPESPRWLMVTGKYDSLRTLLKRICRVNGSQLPADFDPSKIEMTVRSPGVERQTCVSLLTSPTMRLRTFIINFSWFSCSLIYYALSLNTGTLHGNIYVNTFISGAIEAPAYIVAMVMMSHEWFGRRMTGCLSFMGAGLASFVCIPMILTNHFVAATVFSLLGKGFISVTLAVVYVFASEIFPTEVRQVGMGTASTLARVSGMAAPYVGGPLAVIWTPLPSVIFGFMATMAGVLYLLMPETLGQTLPDTIEEAEQLSRRNIKRNLRLQVIESNDQKDTEDDVESSKAKS